LEVLPEQLLLIPLQDNESPSGSETLQDTVKPVYGATRLGAEMLQEGDLFVVKFTLTVFEALELAAKLSVAVIECTFEEPEPPDVTLLLPEQLALVPSTLHEIECPSGSEALHETVYEV
jgi:hypothetical protein